MTSGTCPECGMNIRSGRGRCPNCNQVLVSRNGEVASGGEFAKNEFVTTLTGKLEAAPIDFSDDVDIENVANEIADEALEVQSEIDSDTLREEIRVLSKEIESRTDELSNRLERLEADLPQFERKFDHVQERFADIRAELSQIQVDIRRFPPVDTGREPSSSEGWAHRLQKVEDNHEVIVADLNSLEADLNEFEEWFDNIDLRIDDIESDVKSLETRTEDISTTVDTLEARLSSDTDLKDGRPSFAHRSVITELDQIETESQQAREKITEIQHWITFVDTDHPISKDRLDDLEDRLDEVDVSRADSAETIERLREEYIDAEIDELRSRLETLQDRVAREEAQLPTIDQEFDHVERRFDHYHEQLSNIDSRIEELDQKVSDKFDPATLDRSLFGLLHWWENEFNDEYEWIDEELESLAEETDGLDRWIEDISLRIDELEKSVVELRSRTQQLNEEITAFESELDETAESYETLEQRMKEFDDERQVIMADLEEAMAIHSELDRRHSHTCGSEVDAAQRLSDLESRLDGLDEECATIEDDTHRIRDEYFENPEWQLNRIEYRAEAVEPRVDRKRVKVEITRLRTRWDEGDISSAQVLSRVEHIEAKLGDRSSAPSSDPAPDAEKVQSGPDTAYVQSLNSMELDIGTALTVLAGVGSAAIANDPTATGTFLIGLCGTLYDKTKSSIRTTDGFVYWVGHDVSAEDNQLSMPELEKAVHECRQEVENRIELDELNVTQSVARLERNGCVELSEDASHQIVEFKMRCKSAWKTRSNNGKYSTTD